MILMTVLPSVEALPEEGICCVERPRETASYSCIFSEIEPEEALRLSVCDIRSLAIKSEKFSCWT